MPEEPRAVHCDPNVVHPPGVCEMCDLYPHFQHQRINAGINFTGEQDPNKKPCPAELLRPLTTINKWHGNYPFQNLDAKTKERCNYCKGTGQSLTTSIPCTYCNEEGWVGPEESNA